ncbi:MAG: 4Fe-4S dicluster domain-containing protein [Firmicutes bacterium]|nr:4Fe-4S dicluster domain-containing protein [Bacillota bacterium]
MELCYQCQKCASGCRMAEQAEYAPNQIIKMVQLGMKDKVLNSSSIWLCTSCEICGSRCPNKIKTAEVIDVLKEIAVESNIIKEKNVNLFNQVFLNTVRSFGRIHETKMMMSYKLKSGDLFSDMDLGFEMFKKGKLPLFMKGTKSKNKVKQIFERCKNS